MGGRGDNVTEGEGRDLLAGCNQTRNVRLNDTKEVHVYNGKKSEISVGLV